MPVSQQQQQQYGSMVVPTVTMMGSGVSAATINGSNGVGMTYNDTPFFDGSLPLTTEQLLRQQQLGQVLPSTVVPMPIKSIRLTKGNKGSRSPPQEPHNIAITKDVNIDMLMQCGPHSVGVMDTTDTTTSLSGATSTSERHTDGESLLQGSSGVAGDGMNGAKGKAGMAGTEGSSMAGGARKAREVSLYLVRSEYIPMIDHSVCVCMCVCMCVQ
jgi:hypothetical protein